MEGMRSIQDSIQELPGHSLTSARATSTGTNLLGDPFVVSSASRR